MKKKNEQSKFLSYILRHSPDSIGLELDSQGWASIEQLVDCARKANHEISYDEICEIVASSDKKRFSISDDGCMIRAVQGHSVESVNIDYVAKQPPDILYHGTAQRFLPSILSEGIKPGSRHYVHLSSNTSTAREVGKRYGRPVILLVAALQMVNAGHEFYQADNGVWLTKYVPIQFIREDSSGEDTSV